jgi:Holliday junction resolvase RusA-like endonuclease
MITIVVNGTPRPQGSKTPGRTKSGKLFVRDASPLTAVWREQVAKAAREQYSGELLEGPLLMFLDFRFARPKSHTKKHRPYWHINTPDLTKIIRSTEDSLTGIVYKDDSRICTRTESKRYCNEGEQPGVTIHLTEIADVTSSKD